MGTGENFLNRKSIPHAVRSRIDKWDLIKLQSFCKALSIRQKDHQKIGKGSLPILKSDRGLISNIYKELKKADSRKSKNPIKNGPQS